MTKNEIDEDYETNTGNVIVEEFRRFQKMFYRYQLCYVKITDRLPGERAVQAVHNSVVLEECAKIRNYRTELINPGVKEAPQELIEKHYMRKHGANAYYGQ